MTISKKNFVALSLAVFAMVLMTPEYASATGQLQTALDTIIGWLTGDLGTAIATLAVIIIGIGALMGKVSWGMAIIVAIGIGVVFGAATIVGSLSG